MEGMSIAPEQVEAPARDAVLFRSSPMRTFAAVFLILMVSYVSVSPLVAVIGGSTGTPWWSTVLQAVVIGAVVAAGYAYSHPRGPDHLGARLRRAAWNWPPRAATRSCWTGRTSPAWWYAGRACALCSRSPRSTWTGCTRCRAKGRAGRR